METRAFRFQVLLMVGLIVFTLWSAHPLQAATNIKLSGVMPPFGFVASFQISPDGRYAVYLADQTTNGVNELYSVFLGGGSPVRLNPILPFGRNVTSFQISPDSSRVVYQANQDTPTAFELYSVPIGGPATNGIKLNRALVALGNVVDFKISPDSSPGDLLRRPRDGQCLRALQRPPRRSGEYGNQAQRGSGGPWEC